MNRWRFSVLCGATLALAALTPPGHGDVVVLQPVKDNTLFLTDPPTSSGAGAAVFTGKTGMFGGGVKQRAVLAFHVAGSVPPGSTITSASLTLTLIQQSASGQPEVHSLHRILANWGEGASIGGGGGGAPAQSGDATWLHTFYPTQFWASPGGNFDPNGSASQTVGDALGPYTWGSTAQMVADVQLWLDDPASAFGWLVKGNEAASFTAKKFSSKEEANPALHPKLVVEYTPPASPCPWDCGDGDGNVGIADFLAMLEQWGLVGSACDLGLGAPGVGSADFDALRAHWGRCP